MASLLLMPDEIKIKIFSYLSGEDKLQLLKVCKDFNRVGIDRNIVKRLNFKKCYTLTLAELRFYGRQATAPHVTSLNLNHIHWISSALLRDALIKFVNLTDLFLLDTQLNFRDLYLVLKSTTKVTKLAVTMKPEFCSDVIVNPITLRLTHLYVTYNSSALRVLLALFSRIPSINEIWLIETKIPIADMIGHETAWIGILRCLKVKVINRMVLTRQCGESYYGLSGISPVISDSVWKVTKKYKHGSTVFHIYDTDDTKETTLEYWCNLSFSLREPVKELEDQMNHRMCTQRKEEIKRDFLFSRGAANIWKLKCKSKVFWREQRVTCEEIEPVLFKKRRIGVNAVKLGDNLKFQEFCINSPYMQDFDIDDTDPNGTKDNLWHINDLIYIQNWKMLKKLTITSINMHNGSFLIDVVISCPLLECLKIQDNLVQDNVSISLCNALVHAQNLKDLRFHRKGSIPIDSLFESLANCPKLERLYVQCTSTVKISKKPLETVITNCENIIFLFLYITELPETICKSIKYSINEFGVKPRQIINIRGQSYNLNNIGYEDIPRCHVEEMVCQENEPYTNFLETFFQ